MRVTIFAILMGATAAMGCGGGSSPHTMGSQATCEANCDREVALACPRTPPNFAESCKMLCAASRSGAPQCAAQINAVSACVADKVSFFCDNGVPMVMPIGACSREGQACIACTGDLLSCSG